MTTPLKVLVCDDSVMYRNLMSNVVQGIPNTQLVGSSKNGKEAITFIENNHVDVAFLDIVMPEMDGMQTLEVIKQRFPHIKVVMVSSANRTQADITIKALSSGALDFISKPEGNDIRATMQTLQTALSKIVSSIGPSTASAVPTAPAPRHDSPQSAPQAVSTPVAPASSSSPSPSASQLPRRNANIGAVKALAIASSTGGPDALGKLVPLLSGDLNIPVFITQHMPPVFTASLAAHLDKKSVLTVKEAEDGETVENNTVYIAPGGFHLVVEKVGGHAKIKIDDGPQENSCKPSADVMFRSIPQVYGNHVINVVLTGIGADGTKGVEVQKAVGGYCITQSAETCVVYGMPKAVVEKNLSDQVLPLESIAEQVNALVLNGVRSNLS